MADHRDTMTSLALERGWKHGIELGLGSGYLFIRMLDLGVNMTGVDLGLKYTRVERIKSMSSGKPHTIYWMSTEAAAALVPDGLADFCFIDAGHSYKAASRDIALWQSKVRPGGWFGGHDYHEWFPGVVQAVDEAFGSAVDLLPGDIWARRA